MIQLTVGIEGMMCGHCEAHVNDAVSKAFSVQKVTSSHSKKQTVIVAEKLIDPAKLKQVIADAGYRVTSIQNSADTKKGFFSFLRRS